MPSIIVATCTVTNQMTPAPMNPKATIPRTFSIKSFGWRPDAPCPDGRAGPNRADTSILEFSAASGQRAAVTKVTEAGAAVVLLEAATSVLGQKAKCSLRADVFRIASDSGHVATAAAFPFRAKALNRCAIARCAGSPTARAATRGEMVSSVRVILS
jgi:hypothetical protein